MSSGLPIGLQLVELGLITREQLDVALNLQRKKKERLGELLIALKFISERDVLRVLAERFGVSFLPADKLAGMEISRDVLKHVSIDYAEANLVLPVWFDHKNNALSVLSCQPGDPRIFKEIQLMVQCREVSPILGTAATIKAGIAYFYRGDKQAFDNLALSMMSGDSMLGLASGEESSDPIRDDRVEAARSGTRMADEILSLSLLSDNVYIETLNMLVSMLDMRKGIFRGHSASVARHVKRISEKLKLKPQETYFNLIAAYLHDLGKGDDRHFSLLNLKTDEDRRMAQRLSQAPLRLIESINFPPLIPTILKHVYERWDGKGFPDGLAGESIPRGSRIIAVVESYEDLVRDKVWAEKGMREIWQELARNQGTLFDRTVIKAFFETMQQKDSAQEAQAPSGAGLSVMIIDSAGDTFGEVMARMKEHGFRVMLARDTDTAINTLKNNKVDLVLSEVETRPIQGVALCRAIKDNSALSDVLFVFLSEKDEQPEVVQRCFDAGADDFFAAPLKADLIVAKLRRLLSSGRKAQAQDTSGVPAKSSTVSGSLSQVSLPDILQLLTSSRKKGLLLLRSPDGEGRIYIAEGTVINAVSGKLEGMSAFNQLIRWEKGDFWFDPDAKMTEQKIHGSVQSIILEGLRIWDEEKAGRI